MKEIIFPIEEEINKFEIRLQEVITSCDNFLIDDLNKFMFAKSKRLRPILVYLFSKILRIDNSLVEDISIISELIHSASLLHDDILDEEKIRRSLPTFYEKFGAKLAVLEGDLLLSLSLEMLSNTTLEISKIFAQKIKATINGEIIQNENIAKITDIETYYKKTLDKTGNLFLAGLESLYTLEKIDENIKRSLNSFLANFALAFQIKNDIENFQNDMSDMKNGNYTLPVIYFFKENNTAEFNQQSVEFKKYIDKTNKKVEELKNKALDNLKDIENTIYKNSLIKLTNKILRS